MNSADSIKRIPWMIILVFLGLSLVIGLAGFLFYRSGRAEIKKNIENDLAAIADLKVNLIETWRQERLANATVIRDNQIIAGRIAQWLKKPSDPAFAGSLLIWMAALQRENGYQSILLVDPSGKPRLGTRADNFVDSCDQESLSAAMHSKNVVFSDLYRTRREAKIYLDLYTPLVQGDEGESRVIGIMVLRIDPYKFLFPLIQSWPTPSRSAETLIVRQERDRILFLNELRHRKGSALALSAPLDAQQSPVAKAASRWRGVTEGIDYRGVPVLAALCPVPNTSWVMVAKVDTEEIYTPIRERARITFIIVLLLMAIAGTGVSIGWKHQATQFYRRQLEAERERQALAEEARRQAEEASRMKDEFLATVSHELRTPLNPILGWAYNLRTGAVEPDLLQEGLETIERNARIQSRLVEDLLDISRIIAGKLHMNVQPVYLQSVIEAAVESVHLAAQAKRIDLVLHLDPDVPQVVGDPERLQQVLWNLLSNALKFTPEGGRVEVRLKKTDSHVEASVTDSGEGIPSDFLPYIFDRFRQADSSITRKYGGLGVGLAIVRHLVELHGGIIHAESAGAGKGATFSLQLPVMAAAECVAKPAVESDD
jgi:signal transduction histidine kinase